MTSVSNRPEKMWSPTYGERGRDGEMGWWACLCRRNTVLSTFLNTWTQHVGADPSCVVWQRLCERLLAEKTICCHADIQAIYSMRNGSKSVDVSEEEDNGEGGMDGRWYILGRGTCGYTITFHGSSFSPSDTCFLILLVLFNATVKSTILAVQKTENNNSHSRAAGRLTRQFTDH